MIGKGFFLSIFFSLFCNGTLLGQSNAMRFRHLTSDADLPFSTACNCLFQDADGFMWMGTDAGLYRFDGNDYRAFLNGTGDDNSIRKGKVNFVYQDRSLNLWVGTTSGPALIDMRGNRYHHFPIYSDSTFYDSKDPVKCFFEDSNDDLFLCTYFNIYKLNKQGGYFIRVKTGMDEIDAGGFVIETMFAERDYFVMATDIKGLFVFKLDGKTLSNKNVNNLESKRLTGVFKSSSGQIWISSTKGINVVNSIDELVVENSKRIANVPDANGVLVSRLAEDKNGMVWATTDGDGLYCINPQSLSVVKHKKNDEFAGALLSNKTTLAFVDQQNNLWSFSNSYGFSVANLNHNDFFQTYRSQGHLGNSLSGNNVTSFAQDHSGNIWMGTDGDGLNCFDRSSGRFIHYMANVTNANSLSSNVILCLFVDSQGLVWIGTYQGGLCQYNPNTKGFKVHQAIDNDLKSLSENDVSAITEGKDGLLYVLTISNGLNIYDKKTGRFERVFNDISDSRKLSHNGGTSLYCDYRGNIWVGTYYGLNCIDSKTKEVKKFFSIAGDSLSLNDNEINCIHEDSQHRIWVATPNGLNLFSEKTGTFQRFSAQNGLLDNSIVSIAEDDQGSLWLGSNRGLSKMNLETYKVTNFAGNYNLPGKMLLPRSAFRANNGEMYFGGNKGFTVFKPSKVSDSDFLPKLLITSLKVFDRSIVAGDTLNGHVILPNDISKTNEINFRHTENSFAFTFSSLDYANTAKFDYYYMMDGFDKSWRKAEYPTRTASYTNLDAGKYTFKVKLVSGLSNRESKPVEIAVQVFPPWWRTWWAIIMYFVVVFALLQFYLSIALRNSNLQRKLFVEKNEHQKEVEVSRIKENFYTNITHEFRTPLTLIIGPMEHLIERYGKDVYLSDQLLIVKRNATRLLMLINELLDFRKVEANSMLIRVAELDIVECFVQVAKSFEPHAGNHHIKFDVDSSASKIMVWFDKSKLEKVFYNLLSNAFKYTSDQGTIHCQLSVVDNAQVLIKIEDDGIGIPEDDLKDVFNKFFSSRNVNEQFSTGIGLYLTKEIVELHKGVITAQNNKGKGACFEVCLKLGNSHFSKDELMASVSVPNPFASNPLGAVDQPILPVIENVQPEVGGEDIEKQLVLIVEDNEDVRAFVRNELVENYEIIEASTGSQGLAIAMERIPDLVISDVMMPEMDGRTLCAQLKASELTCHIPVILLTALSDIENRIEGLGVGADSYITKPFHPRHLTVRVSKLLELRKVLQGAYNKQAVTVESAGFHYKAKDLDKLSVDELFLERLVVIVEENMADSNFELDDLCSSVGMKYLQLYRKVKAITNLSLKQFILTIRMKNAVKLLESGKFTISEVAFDVGFSSPAYFSETFKKHFGITPTDYIRKGDA